MTKEPLLAMLENMTKVHGPLVISPSLEALVRAEYGEAWLKEYCIVNKPIPIDER